jgi:hypothetical protein
MFKKPVKESQNTQINKKIKKIILNVVYNNRNKNGKNTEDNYKGKNKN